MTTVITQTSVYKKNKKSFCNKYIATLSYIGDSPQEIEEIYANHIAKEKREKEEEEARSLRIKEGEDKFVSKFKKGAFYHDLYHDIKFQIVRLVRDSHSAGYDDMDRSHNTYQFGGPITIEIPPIEFVKEFKEGGYYHNVYTNEKFHAIEIGENNCGSSTEGTHYYPYPTHCVEILEENKGDLYD